MRGMLDWCNHKYIAGITISFKYEAQKTQNKIFHSQSLAKKMEIGYNTLKWKFNLI